jgi:sulfide:quinone oxidoreductase
LVEVRPKSNEAVFQVNPAFAKADYALGEQVTLKYDFLHAVPPMSAPAFLKESGLTDAAGFVDVHKQTLQHVKYPNVFGLGDSSNLPTSKTMAAVAAQVPVVRFRAGKYLKTKEVSGDLESSNQFPNFVAGEGPIYDGYTSCPLPVGNGKAIIAEFNYDLQPQETLPWDQSQPSTANFLIKAYALPTLYWKSFLKGQWEGPWKIRNFTQKVQ